MSLPLTDEQKDFLRKIVQVYNEGCHSEFLFPEATQYAGSTLIYDNNRQVPVNASQADLDWLARQGFITLRGVGRGSFRGRPTAEAIGLVARGFAQAAPEQPLVFISCGQYTPEEKNFGQAVCNLVEEQTGTRAYFAQNQNSLQGLKENIFEALNGASGFIGIMHHRGSVSGLDGMHTRASVWVEQEIAIAAFLVQIQNRVDLPVAVYMQRGIKREGVRQLLHLNEVEFESAEDVLADLRARIGDGRFRPLVKLVGPLLRPEIGFEKQKQRSTGELHRYQLMTEIENIGSDKVEDYWVEILFPSAVIARDAILYGDDRTRNTATHAFFRYTRKDVGRPIYPGDKVRVGRIEYIMNVDLSDRPGLLDLLVQVAVCASGMQPQRVEKPFRDVQAF